MTPLERSITRDLLLTHRRQRLVARFCSEGIYLKGRGQRWTSAYLLPWAAAYDTAVKMRVMEEQAARRARRKKR